MTSLHAFMSLMPITYYTSAFIYEKHIQFATMFKTELSRCQQTVTTSINSKVCDMMVDSLIHMKVTWAGLLDIFANSAKQ